MTHGSGQVDCQPVPEQRDGQLVLVRESHPQVAARVNGKCIVLRRRELDASFVASDGCS